MKFENPIYKDNVDIFYHIITMAPSFKGSPPNKKDKIPIKNTSQRTGWLVIELCRDVD
jgi:hypothetical protein